MNIDLLLIPIISALIGWVTNYIAVKMLFHPRKPWRLLWIFPIQGVFPKRQNDLARKLGTLVSQELVSSHEIRHKAESLATAPEIVAVIEQRISQALTQRLPQVIPMAAMFLSPALVAQIVSAFRPDLESMVKELAGSLGERIEREFDIHALVEQKVQNFSADKLEEILNAIMKREFRVIELLGGVLGFAIGVAQAGIVYYRL